MDKKDQDIIFGSISEKNNKSIIESITGSLNKTLGKYDIFDYYNDNYIVELKTRRNNYNKYPTTMIGNNKLIKASKDTSTKIYIFCFKFTDGLYYHKYDRNYNYDIDIGGRNDRNKEEYKNYAYIPIKLLKKI